MTVLVDTSVWVAHFRASLPEMAQLLQSESVASHTIVVGELAVGNLRDRTRTLADLRSLLFLTESSPKRSLDLLEAGSLFGQGLGWGDIQILATCVQNGIPLWTLDKRLEQAALVHGCSWSPASRV